ncbi:MAG: hypothetical protein WC700_14930 [Gemmatimonadaceae bacterium]|jgi:hypothetical protein
MHWTPIARVKGQPLTCQYCCKTDPLGGIEESDSGAGWRCVDRRGCGARRHLPATPKQIPPSRRSVESEAVRLRRQREAERIAAEANAREAQRQAELRVEFEVRAEAFRASAASFVPPAPVVVSHAALWRTLAIAATVAALATSALFFFGALIGQCGATP